MMQPPDSDDVPQVQTESEGAYCSVFFITYCGSHVQGHKSNVGVDFNTSVFATTLKVSFAACSL